MRTRVASIIIEENQDGRKRRVGQNYPADALLLMDAQTAGEGFLQIVSSLVRQLDGPVQEDKPAFPAPESTVASAQPEPAPAPAPAPALTRAEEIARITTKRQVKKPVDRSATPA